MALSKKEMGELVRRAREIKSKAIGRKYTQTMLANDIGCKSQGYIGDIESGRTYPSYTMLQDIARVCGVPLSFFDERNAPKHVGLKLKELRGDRSIEEYAAYLKISPITLQIYEDGCEMPPESTLEYIVEIEGLPKDYFYDGNYVSEAEEMYSSGIDEQMKAWINNPENEEYLEFIYKAYKRGISKELLRNAEITIKLN